MPGVAPYQEYVASQEALKGYDKEDKAGVNTANRILGGALGSYAGSSIGKWRFGNSVKVQLTGAILGALAGQGIGALAKPFGRGSNRDKQAFVKHAMLHNFLKENQVNTIVQLMKRAEVDWDEEERKGDQRRAKGLRYGAGAGAGIGGLAGVATGAVLGKLHSKSILGAILGAMGGGVTGGVVGSLPGAALGWSGAELYDQAKRPEYAVPAGNPELYEKVRGVKARDYKRTGATLGFLGGGAIGVPIGYLAGSSLAGGPKVIPGAK